jgi:hypothetical protein
MAIMEAFVVRVAIAVLVDWLLIIGGVFTSRPGSTVGGTWRLLMLVLLGVLYVAGGVYFRTWVSLRLPHLPGLGSELVFAIGPKPQIATYLK